MKAKVKANIRPELSPGRFKFLVWLLSFIFIVLVAKAASIQVISPDKLRHESDIRSVRTNELEVQRGLITDRYNDMLAVSVPMLALVADPQLIAQNDGFADVNRWQALAEVIGVPYAKIKHRIESNPKLRWLYLKRQLTPGVANYIRQLKLPGLLLSEESRRYYPAGETIAQLIGITNIDDQGIEGIERAYDQWLTGTSDKVDIRRNNTGEVVEILSEIKSGKPSKDLNLSIDLRIQSLAYQELKNATANLNATSASLVVLDVKTGEILAMANTPSFNPNVTSQRQPFRVRNRAISDTFEPGSTVKPFVIAAALEAGVLKPEEVIATSPGYMRLGGSYVRDGRDLGDLTVQQVLLKSSNVGTSKIAQRMPAQEILGTYYALGLGSFSGLQLNGEQDGLINERYRWSDFEKATLSFGYGFTVTTLQMARMYSVLANEGKMMPVTILKRAKVDGEVQLPEATQVLSKEVADKVLKMLVGITKPGGTALKAHIEGYPVAGKTGTSEKAVAGGYGNDYVASFVGVAPAHDPKLVIAVMINEPKGDDYHGGDAAAPVFAKVMAGALQMLNVEPVIEQQLQFVNLQERVR
ncbi:penicillin-binding protein 2 [Paraferrimonas sp. SM1919]|uniref:peptidoglycan D,D-transpeptidase FtsI family protein n=1 Tax=Paraferrimonas sp. SM1919 TaxID=2662263 RepID=UPI0013D7B253|nr:penicillin-binding transpeptidase domain-containing protein [Paraferrimonas sp. SM1919]